MVNIEDIEELQHLIYYNLVVNSPVFSGNMQNMISGLGLYGLDPVNGEARVLITAPSYDIERFKKEGIIVHDGKRDYAYFVNEYGGFGANKSSKHWVNKVINECCEIFAKSHGGMVVNYLPD